MLNSLLQNPKVTDPEREELVLTYGPLWENSYVVFPNSPIYTPTNSATKKVSSHKKKK